MLDFTKVRICWLVVLFSITIVLSLTKVWVSIEKFDLAYDLKKLQKEYAVNMELKFKLLAEKNNLLSPSRLKKLAKDMDLFMPGADKVRKLQYAQEYNRKN